MEASVTPDAYGVVKDFEKALCEYTGAKYAVTCNSCTSALQMCFMYHRLKDAKRHDWPTPWITLPKRTYVSVPMVAKLTGHRITWDDEEWLGRYRCPPYPVWDSARFMSKNMYAGMGGDFMCLSFHWTKVLKIGLGGCILHQDDEADPILRRMRFDGRTEGVAPKDDTFPVLGFHAYMTPAIAAEGLVRLSLLPDWNDPLPNSDYPDLSQYPVFQ